MKKYKVLKSFPSSDGGFVHEEGNEYRPTKSKTRTANLLRLGYIKEIPQVPKTVWDLEGEDYCFVAYTNGNIGDFRWGCSALKERLREYRENGNIFMTSEEAEKEIARRKAKQILLRDTKGFKPDWKNNKQSKFGIAYNGVKDKLIIQEERGYCFAHIYFATAQDAEASIRVHETEWKIYLGVEERWDKKYKEDK